MTMMIVGAQCDKCGEVIWFSDYTTKRQMETLLRKAGWSVGGRSNSTTERTLCPICRRRKPKYE